MTKYTVGEWHTHNGKHNDDLPEGLHRESVVHIRDAVADDCNTAEDFTWKGPLLWSLVKEHVEPKKPFELWANVYDSGEHYSYRTKEQALDRCGPYCVTKHMREVLE